MREMIKKLHERAGSNDELRQVRNEVRDVKDALDTLVGAIERFNDTPNLKLIQQARGILDNVEKSAIRKLNAVLDDLENSPSMVKRVEVERKGGAWVVTHGPLPSGNWVDFASFDNKDDAIESAMKLAKRQKVKWYVVS